MSGLTSAHLERKAELLELVRTTLQMEADAVGAIARSVDDSYFHALSLLASSAGKVVLTGVGKSGLIARKIAATMSSTGTPATFLHPSDGMHGDLGVLSAGDVVIAIGKSGESEELVRLMPAIKRLGAKIIGITSVAKSTLAEASDVVLLAPVEREACPLDLAPTVSTTVALAIGDALAVALMNMKNFRSEDFARYHPGGKLGKRLLLRVADLMIPRDRCAVLDVAQANIEDVIIALSKYGHGIVMLMDAQGILQGIVTDGDIRRLLQQHKVKIFELDLKSVMNKKPTCISPEMQAVEALKIMEERPKPLNVVPIAEGGKVMGIVRLHELLSVS